MIFKKIARHKQIGYAENNKHNAYTKSANSEAVPSLISWQHSNFKSERTHNRLTLNQQAANLEYHNLLLLSEVLLIAVYFTLTRAVHASCEMSAFQMVILVFISWLYLKTWWLTTCGVIIYRCWTTGSIIIKICQKKARVLNKKPTN